MDWFFGWFYELLYVLQKSICFLIDFIYEVFTKLVGINTVAIDGKEEDLLSHFITSTAVRNAFLGVILVGVILLVVFVGISIIKSEVAQGQNKKTKGQILSRAFQSFLTFIVLPFVIIAAIVFTNAVMGAIHTSMTATAAGGGGISFGGQLLVTSGADAFKGGNRAEIERLFITGGIDYNNIAVVKEYYDLSEMNFFVGITSGLILLIMFALSAVTFIQRLFDIALLYIVSPVSAATIPLDDGGRFKIWREMLIAKLLGAYGIVLAMNLFFILSPQLQAIQFFDTGFKNGVVKLLFLIGGAFAVMKANLVISQLTGNNGGSRETQQLLANITYGKTSVFRGYL